MKKLSIMMISTIFVGTLFCVYYSPAVYADDEITITTEANYNCTDSSSTSSEGYMQITVNGVTDSDSDGHYISYDYAILSDNSEPSDSDFKDAGYDEEEGSTSGWLDIQYYVDDNEEVFQTCQYIYLTVKQVESTSGTETIIVDKEKLEIALPYYFGGGRTKVAGTYQIYFKTLFGITEGQYQSVKITDEDVIELAEEYFDSSTSDSRKEELSSELLTLIPTEDEAPTSGWSDFSRDVKYELNDIFSLDSSDPETVYFYVWTKLEAGTDIIGLNLERVTNGYYGLSVSSTDDDDNNSSSTTTTSTGKTEDTTTATTSLPYAGEIVCYIIFGVVLLVGIGGIIAYKKFNHLNFK